MQDERVHVCPKCRVAGAMPEQHLALLRSLALRPAPAISDNLAPIVSALQVAGCVTRGSEGWTATAVGCATIEQSRTVLPPVRNLGPNVR